MGETAAKPLGSHQLAFSKGRANALRDVLALLELVKRERPGYDWGSDIDALTAEVEAMLKEEG